MRLTKTSTQAVLAVAYLSDRPAGELIQARHVAAHLGIPIDSALKILQSLARSGLIHSQIGRNGGYRLERSPRETTLLQIVEAIDGPLGRGLPLHQVPAGATAALDRLETYCAQIIDRLREELGRVTVEDLARQDAHTHFFVASA